MTRIFMVTMLSVPLPGEIMAVADGGEPRPLIQKGMAALRAGKVDEALTLAEQAVRVAQREPRAYLLRGSVYAAQRRHRKAIADFDTCRRGAFQARRD